MREWNFHRTWRRHQMKTFSALLALCAWNSPVTGEFPAQRPVTRSFDVLFELRLNKRLSKQSCGWWFETQSRSLWRHCNDLNYNERIVREMTPWERIGLSTSMVFEPQLRPPSFGNQRVNFVSLLNTNNVAIGFVIVLFLSSVLPFFICPTRGWRPGLAFVGNL